MRHLCISALLLGLFVSPAPSSCAGYAKPDPARAFPDLKIYDVAGRPWRVAREDWDGARHRIKTERAWSHWLAKERAAVDRWIAKPRDRVEWAAGWSHDGVSPKDGSRLLWTEDVPGEEVEFFRSSTDPRVPITPKTFAWWVVNLRGRNVDTMVSAAQLYRLTGDARYAAWAAGQMDFYADNYLNWAPVRDGARLFWQTLTEATNLIKFVETVRLLDDYVAPARRQRWREQFFDPEVAVLNGNYQNVHNIACWQRGAVAQVALLFGDDALWHEAIEGAHGIRAQLREGVTSDYLWHEQSFGYNGYVVSALHSLFVAAGLHGRADTLADEMTIAENLLLSPIYYRFPNGQLPNPADSTGIGTAPNTKLIGSFYRVFPTTLGLTAVAKQRDWNTLLDPPAPGSADGPPAGLTGSGRDARAPGLPAPISRNLETTRMAILKSGPWQVFFHYGQLTRSHSQSEALNFSAAYGETDITHDAGTAGYGSPLHRGYFTRGLAQNVPLVGGEGQDLGPLGERREWIVEQATPLSPTRGELLEFSAQPARVSAAQPRYRRDTRAQRTLAIEGNTLVDTVTVETIPASPAASDAAPNPPQPVGLALHLQGKVRLPEAFTSDPAFATGRPEPYQFWHDARRASFRDRAEFDVACGNLVLRVTISCPGDFTLWHASTPDVPPTRRESLYLETKGPSATFTTTFSPK
ncbi:MAG TPA: heparinase [Opitutaceae bacterium]